MPAKPVIDLMALVHELDAPIPALLEQGGYRSRRRSERSMAERAAVREAGRSNFSAMPRAGPHTAARRRRMLEAHRAAIAARMRQLEETADVLDGKIAQYREMENL